MLIHYLILYLIIALFCTRESFSRHTERYGRTFYFLIGSLSWMIVGYGTLRMTWRGPSWPGDGSIMNYTYIPDWEAWVVLPPIFTIATLMLLIGIFHRSWDTMESIRGGNN